MKSGKQRRAEIKARRIEQAKLMRGMGARALSGKVPAGAVASDPSKLTHNFFCTAPPAFYVDRAFRCRDCGSDELWTAKQQKWWYEEAKGHIDSTAVRCKPCRRLEQARKADARRISEDGLRRKFEAKNSGH
jgi:hypothetical protein